MNNQYNKAQIESVIIVRIVTNVLSLSGSTFIVLMFTINRSLRNFAFYLIFNVALSDMMSSIATFIVTDTRSID